MVVVQVPLDDGAVMIRLLAVTVPFVEELPSARTQRPVDSEELDSFCVDVFRIDVEDEIVTAVWLVAPWTSRVSPEIEAILPEAPPPGAPPPLVKSPPE